MRWLRPILFALSATVATASTFTWTGGAGDGAFSNPANWSGGVAPTEDGTATVVFTDAGAGTVRLPTNANLAQIQFQNTSAQSYQFSANGVSVLTLQKGVSASGGGSSSFSSAITVNAPAAETIAVSSGSVEIDGVILGTGSLQKTGAGTLRIGGVNTLAGGLTDSAGTITFSHLGGLGLGPIHLAGGQVNVSGAGPVFIANPVTIDADTSFSGVNNQVAIFTGNVTLTKSVTLTANNTDAVFFTGNVTETGGSHGLSISGFAPIVLTGTNSYTGGPIVLGGELVFGENSAIPRIGSISSSSLGYVGVAFTDRVQSDFIARIAGTAFNGTIGFDSAPWQSRPTVFSANLDLSSLLNYKSIGSLTTAELAGQINVANGSNYRFGGGGGTIFLDSNLNKTGRNLQVTSDFGTPLTLVLRGLNDYTGSTNVLDSIVILDRANTLPSQSALNLTGPGYVGITENAGLKMNDFLRRISSIGNSDAIAGIDSANTNVNRVVNDAIDLSVGGTRSQSYYLGTSSRVTLTGTITPPKGQSLSMTAIRGGYLTVASTLGSTIPGLIIGQTNSFDPEQGTVELTGSNSYTGGTEVRGGTLRVSNNHALGLAGVTVDSGGALSVASNTTIGNAISLNSGATLTGTGTLAGANGLFVGRGAILAPGGFNTIGTLTFSSGLTLGAGGILDLDTIGSNSSALSSDRLSITGGALTLASTGGSPFVIELNSLSSNGTAGAIAGFDAHLSYHWTFATANSITGFASNDFSFDTSHFLNATDGGSFFVSQNGNSLVINFTPVPEPSTYALLALGLGAIGLSQWRRKKAKTSTPPAEA